MEFKDYYGTLGISRQATPDEIKRAYRRLAHKYHPDVSKEANSEQRFKAIQEAYEVLKDPEKRATYDHVGNSWSAGQKFRPPPNWDTSFTFKGNGSEQNLFSDFFETLFGRGRTDFKRNYNTSFNTNDSKLTPDHHAKIKIDLEDAYCGATRSLSLAIPDVDYQGRVVTKERTLRVKIPPGIAVGKRIRLSGQGNEQANGTRGDLYLEVLFNPHKIFRADNLDIHMDLPVTPWEVAL
ncbi:cytochrome C biogenesis protein, partial [Achromatium sp. WMS1]